MIQRTTRVRALFSAGPIAARGGTVQYGLAEAACGVKFDDTSFRQDDIPTIRVCTIIAGDYAAVRLRAACSV
jgi:hypothetical protein